MSELAYKLIMMLIKYLTSKDFINFVEAKVRQMLKMGEQNPEAIKVAVKDEDNGEHGINDMLIDAVIGLVTHEEMKKMKVEPSKEPTTQSGRDLLDRAKVKANV